MNLSGVPSKNDTVILITQICLFQVKGTKFTLKEYKKNLKNGPCQHKTWQKIIQK